MQNSKHLNANEEDFPMNPALLMQHLPYFEDTQSRRIIKAFLDENIKESKYYRPLIHTISTLSEDDLVFISINSYGGDMDGAISLINAINATDATVICSIEGVAASAASLIALAAPQLQVSPFASMMIHAATFGSFGKQSDVMSQASFFDKQIRDLMKNIYEGFLTEHEFQEVVMGREIWMNYDEICSRLDRRAKHQERKAKPKRKPSSKVKTAEEQSPEV